jgi:hypothetical protein
VTVDSIPVTEQLPRRILVGERFGDLLSCPGGSRVRRDAEVKHAPPVMSEQKEDEENLVPDSRHDEEVDREDLPEVALEEGAPGGGGRLAPARHVLLDGRQRKGNLLDCHAAPPPSCPYNKKLYKSRETPKNRAL